MVAFAMRLQDQLTSLVSSVDVVLSTPPLQIGSVSIPVSISRG